MHVSMRLVLVYIPFFAAAMRCGLVLDLLVDKVTTDCVENEELMVRRCRDGRTVETTALEGEARGQSKHHEFQL